MKLKKKQRIILLFIIGYAMVTAGLLLFVGQQVAESGIFGWTILGIHAGKILLVIPILIGILWLFINYESIEAKLIVAMGALIVILPAVKSVQYRFSPIGIRDYLIMMVLIFGGIGLILWAIHMKNKDSHLFDEK